MTEALAKYLRDEGIQVEVGVVVQRVENNGDGVCVRARIAGEPREFTGERIFCTTGRKPNTTGFGLAEAGVRLNATGHIEVTVFFESSVPDIYGAGDVIGEPAFVYTAAYGGNLAARNALGPEKTARNYTALPWVVFTDPQVAGVGLNGKQAGAAGIAVDVARLDLGYVPRAIAARDTRGFIELVKAHDGDTLLGARILAPEGGEQIMGPVLAIRFGIGVSELASAFHPYLTQAEGIKLCVQTFARDVSKLSCCSA